MSEKNDKPDLLSEEILADAQRKAERALKRAHREAEKIKAKALDDAEAHARRVEEAADAQARTTADGALAGLSLALKVHELQARERYVEEVFDEAAARFSRAGGDARRQAITRLAVEAVAAIPASAVTLQPDEADAAWADAAWAAQVAAEAGRRRGRGVTVRLLDPSPAVRNGVVAASADGRMRVDNTLAARLQRGRAELREKVAEILFPTPGQEKPS